MLDRAPKQWDKWPDAPLLQVVRGKLEDRARMEAGGGRRARLKKSERERLIGSPTAPP